MGKVAKGIGITVAVIFAIFSAIVCVIAVDVWNAEDEVAEATVETTWFIEKSYEPMIAWSHNPTAAPPPANAVQDLADHADALSAAIELIGTTMAAQLDDESEAKAKETLASILIAQEMTALRVKQLDEEFLAGRHADLKVDDLATFKAWAMGVEEIIGGARKKIDERR